VTSFCEKTLFINAIWKSKSFSKNLFPELQNFLIDGYYSTSKTCEIALSEATGENYESILKLLYKVIKE
jgi:hypothetical protein